MAYVSQKEVRAKLIVQKTRITGYLKICEHFADFVVWCLMFAGKLVDSMLLWEVQKEEKLYIYMTVDYGSCKKKNSSEKYSEEEVPGEKVFWEENSGMTAQKLMYLEEERIFLRLHDKPGCRFSGMWSSSLGQTMNAVDNFIYCVAWYTDH